MDSYLGEIRLFAGSFAPQDWLYCDGSLLNIADYQALFALLGVRYGGDGKNTFALPDLRGRVPVHKGAGPGLTARSLGQSFGSETNTLDLSGMAKHTHTFIASNQAASSVNLNGLVLAQTPASDKFYILAATDPTKNVSLLNTTTPTVKSAIGYTGGIPEGGVMSHNNLMPSLALNYIISVRGNYPTQQ